MAETLPLTSIRTDGNTQARIELSNAVIAEYAEAFERGDMFPPIDVYFDGETYWLADGFHRIKAAAQIGQVAIAAMVHEGGQREALLHAVGANTAHGLRRSNADKRKAVMLLLQDDEWQQWSDRQIARHCSVDGKTVADVRQKLTAEIRSQPDLSRAGDVTRDDEKRTYRTRHGTVATMNTGRIGTTQRPQPANIITMPAGRTKDAPAARAGVQAAAAPAASAVIPQREVIAPPVSPPVGSPTVVAPQPAQQEEPVTIPTAPALVRAWEQASEAERQEFVTEYRTVLQELLAVKEEWPAGLPPDIQPDTQPGLILTALYAATEPLSLEDLAQVSGVNRRVLGRNLTRLYDAGRIEKTANGCYVPRAVSQ